MSTAYQPTPQQPWTVVRLHYCEACGKLCVLPAEHKYCRKCAQHLLQPDPIDVAIAQMIEEQRNLLNRKYLRANLSRRIQ